VNCKTQNGRRKQSLTVLKHLTSVSFCRTACYLYRRGEIIV